MTFGELIDLVEGHRYAAYVDAQRDARLACWICNGSGMRDKALRIDDLVGIWVDGRTLGKNEYRRHLEDEVRKERGVR